MLKVAWVSSTIMYEGQLELAVPDVFVHPSTVSLSLGVLKFLACFSPLLTSDLDGINRHQRPVSSALKI